MRAPKISASITATMAAEEGNPPLSFGSLGAGTLLGAWLVACDGWIKLLTRAAACPDVDSLGDAMPILWSTPAGCRVLEVGGGISLSVAARAGATPWQVALPPGIGPVWGLALLGIATVLSVLVLRWRWRIGGDALALGTLWAGALLHGIPRLVAGGQTVTELQIGSIGTGVGDLALGWALVWLAWRWFAEYRA